jgi:Ran GTPase-activating protein (RanGAP) involved in mRNA processing and transport
MELNNANMKVSELGKFNKIKKNELNRILQFLTDREVVCIINPLHKKMKQYLKDFYKVKDDQCISCLRDMKSLVKSIDEYKTITYNHCTTLDDNLRKYKEQHNPLIYNKAIQLLSYSLFKDLTTLELQKNNLGVDGVLLLGPLIICSKVLNNLNLSYNNLEDEGCKFLADYTKYSSCIQVLSLDCNAIGDDGIISLSEVIATHKSLKTVKFVLNHITFEGVKLLASLLEKFSNSTICVIDMKYNNIVLRDEGNLEYFRKMRICF